MVDGLIAWSRGSRFGLFGVAVLVGVGAIGFRYLIYGFTWLATGQDQFVMAQAVRQLALHGRDGLAVGSVDGHSVQGWLTNQSVMCAVAHQLRAAEPQIAAGRRAAEWADAAAGTSAHDPNSQLPGYQMWSGPSRRTPMPSATRSANSTGHWGTCRSRSCTTGGCWTQTRRCGSARGTGSASWSRTMVREPVG